ncbi:MAG: alpha/beta hydrolase domain-containing protein [Hyphomonadaceae bacterium]|nr:MAG: alpha/beta hydrolase domain-containing protein [Hyphomonadaceae bacterium]KAF0186317.1 MAG: alpha/beta hydrolase domain-containing protein [Hyphomonadaceae bacterium]
MTELILSGPVGRIEARYNQSEIEGSPIALILHGHPRAAGSMQDRVAVMLHKLYVERGFSTLRFNFRGVGKSQGSFDNGTGELADAASMLDWLQGINPNAKFTWVAGYSFGAYIALQLLMRRPEIDAFIAVATPCNHYDLSFLAPCPSSGMMYFGSNDLVSPPLDVERSVSKIRTQKGELVEWEEIEGADHFYKDQLGVLRDKASAYIDRTMALPRRPVPAGRR